MFPSEESAPDESAPEEDCGDTGGSAGATHGKTDDESGAASDRAVFDGAVAEGAESYGDVLLAQLRVWMAERVEDETLIEDQAPEPLLTITEALDGVNTAMDGTDVSALDGEALMGTVLALEGVQRRLDSIKAFTLGALDLSGVCESKSGLGVKSWKSNRTHNAAATVARELKIARIVARFELFAAALAEGLISTDHVLGLAQVCNDRTLDGLLELEGSLVQFAKLHRYRVFVAYLRRVVAVLDADGAEPDCSDSDTAAMGTDAEGHLHVTLELSGLNAVEIEGIINTEVDRQYRAAVREHEAAGVPVPATGVLRARAVAELLRRGADPNRAGAKPVASVVLAVSADRDGRPVGIHTNDGAVVDQRTAAALFCDAYFHRVVVDPSNNPLNLGRTTRLFTKAQKQALVLRDGGCVFPGCDQPSRRCAAHHEHSWDDGGLTDIDNGALLCARHHGLLHSDRSWTLGTHDISDLPGDLLQAHEARAAGAHLEPASRVKVFRDPGGGLWLAQNAADHHGPAPNRRRDAA